VSGARDVARSDAWALAVAHAAAACERWRVSGARDTGPRRDGWTGARQGDGGYRDGWITLLIRDAARVQKWWSVDLQHDPYAAPVVYAPPAPRYAGADLMDGYSAPVAHAADVHFLPTSKRRIQRRDALIAPAYWILTPSVDRRVCSPWKQGACRPEDYIEGGEYLAYGPPYSAPPARGANMDLADGYAPPAAHAAHVVINPGEWRQHPGEWPAGWFCYRDSVTDDGFSIDPEIIEKPDPKPWLRTYLIMPSIEITRLSDGAPILANAVTLSASLDDWGWSLSLTPSRGEDRDLIRPTAAGPTEIEIVANGYSFRGLIRKHGRSRQRDAKGVLRPGYSASGYGLSAYLASPYAPVRSTTQDFARNASQLAAEELPLGWTLQWDSPDWLVPGGVWSYSDLTPIQAISRLAAACGGVVQSDPTAQSITVRPRYPTSPWDWGGASIDRVLGSAIRSIDEEWSPQPAYNAVWITGQAHGVQVRVLREGTAGDVAAAQVVEPICTAVECGQERGRNILSAGGAWEHVAISLPLFPAPELPGLVLPGHMVEVTDDGDAWVGQCTAISINASRESALTVYQNLIVEKYYG
jgi:hypothetical protein